MDTRLEIDYLELLPLEYKKEVEDLIKALNNAPNCDAKHDLLQNFVEKFTTLPEIWEFWPRVLVRGGAYYSIKWDYEYQQKRYAKDFPQKEDEWPKIKSDPFRYNNKTLKEKLDVLEDFISLPHSRLRYAFDRYQEISTKPISKQLEEKYKTSCKLYQEMKEADINDSQQYIRILKKTKKDEFVIKNIECQLAKNPWCKNLWNAYIHFLEENEKKDEKALLSVLRRYCRFFVNDKKVKEKYRSTIEEFSQRLDGISEFWIDSIKFELQFDGKNAAMAIVEKALKSKIKDFLMFCDDAIDLANEYDLSDVKDKVKTAKQIYLKEKQPSSDYKNVIKSVSFANPAEPKLPFGDLINAYIMKHVDCHHLQKLYQTCKWFYHKYHYNLVHKLTCFNQYENPEKTIEFINDSLSIVPCQVTLNSLKNLWLTHSLFVTCSLKSILKKVTKISLKALYVQSRNFYISEYKILAASKTVEKLHSKTSIYVEGNFEEIPLEDILKEVPRAKHIIINDCHVTFKTPIKLSKMKFINKIESLTLTFTMNKPKKFMKFLKNNLAPLASLNLLAYGDSSENFHDVVKKKIKKWTPCNEKPIFHWLP